MYKFWTNLKKVYNAPNETVIEGGSLQLLVGAFDWQTEFDTAFYAAIHHPRIEKIHFNLQGIILNASTPTYTSFIKKFANNGVFLTLYERPGKDFLVTAWELFKIGSDPILCNSKTIFYKNSDLQEDVSARTEICKGAFQ